MHHYTYRLFVESRQNGAQMSFTGHRNECCDRATDIMWLFDRATPQGALKCHQNHMPFKYESKNLIVTIDIVRGSEHYGKDTTAVPKSHASHRGHYRH